MDFVYLYQCELCFECVHCLQCYNLTYSRFCTNCSESRFLRDCIGCKNCFGCANLRQKQYCVFNEQKTKAEYETFVKGFVSSSHEATKTMRAEAERFFLTQPVKAMRGEQNVNSVGDNVSNCKNAFSCFDSNYQEDCRYCTNCMMQAKDCGDVHVWGDGLELCHESCCIGANSRGLLFDYFVSQACSDVLYSIFCSHGCNSLFGCVGLRRKKHCILNMEYGAEEYGELASRIADHMKKTGEWGQFFPPEIACFGYNETMAKTFFPLVKDDVTKRGWQWCDYEADIDATRVIRAEQLPDNVKDIPDDVLAWAINCEVTGKPFKIIRQELDFLREHRLPAPRRHPDVRHQDRYAFKNPYEIFDRECANCRKKIQTTYAPERPEIVYCEKCYLEAVY